MLRQGSNSSIRAVVAALTIFSFITISTFLYIANPSVTKLDQSSASISQVQATATQNTTTYSWATSTGQSLSATSTQTQLTPTTTETHLPYQDFGSQYFEPPSAILIPSNTLIWTKFNLDGISDYPNASVAGTISYYPFPSVIGANITVAVYANGNLIANSTTQVIDYNNDSRIVVTKPSLIPSSITPNSIFALAGITLQAGVGTESEPVVNISSAIITVALVCDKPLWLAGWTQSDMSKGTGSQFGQSTGQLPNTYEAPETGTSLPPNSLPQPTTTLSFELEIAGGLSP